VVGGNASLPPRDIKAHQSVTAPLRPSGTWRIATGSQYGKELGYYARPSRRCSAPGGTRR
jgi:hypothetical protein